jgi:disulfide oxidoreductase YuzD
MKKKLDTFNAWMPIDLGKEINYTHTEFQDGSPRDEPQRIKIMGIASTEAPDEVGEIIVQDGIDWHYFLKRGFLNLEHKQGPEFVMGQPEAVTKTSYKGYGATMLKGYLYKDKSSVKALIETMEAMKKAGADRSIGLSVEGQVVERDKMNPKIIKRSKVLNVSITSNPCNADATMEIIKNMNKIEKHEREYHDKDMTYRQIKILKEYADEMCELLDQMPENVDLMEWVQTKVTRALDYIQSSYHYMKVKMPEMMEHAEMMGKDMCDKCKDCDGDCSKCPKCTARMEREEKYAKDYKMELMRVKKEMEDDGDKEAKVMAEMLLERFPELKDPKVMGAIHEMMDDKEKGYGKNPDNMTPSEFDAHMENQMEDKPERPAPDFAEIQSAKIDAQTREPKMPKEEELEASVPSMQSLAPIVPQSLEDEVSYRDYGMSSKDVKTILEYIVRKYPQMEKGDQTAMFMEMMQQMRRVYQTQDVAPKHPK